MPSADWCPASHTPTGCFLFCDSSTDSCKHWPSSASHFTHAVMTIVSLKDLWGNVRLWVGNLTEEKLWLCSDMFWMREFPCGGGVQYLHRSPASRRRRRKGNPVPGGIIGLPCSWGIWIRGLGPPGWGSLESGTVKCGHESRGTRTWEWLRWRKPAAIVNDRPIHSSERMSHKDYDIKCSIENKKVIAETRFSGLTLKTYTLPQIHYCPTISHPPIWWLNLLICIKGSLGATSLSLIQSNGGKCVGIRKAVTAWWTRHLISV
jgi:hypothetical protein